MQTKPRSSLSVLYTKNMSPALSVNRPKPFLLIHVTMCYTNAHNYGFDLQNFIILSEDLLHVFQMSTYIIKRICSPTLYSKFSVLIEKKKAKMLT